MMAGFYFRVYNTAIGQQVSFDKEQFATLQEAKEYRDQLRREYGQIGCHTVQMFAELYPDEEDEDEDIYDDMEDVEDE